VTKNSLNDIKQNALQVTNNQERLHELLLQLAFEKREVTLASGQKSNVYLDCRQVYFRGEAQYLIGEIFYQKLLKFESLGDKFDAIGGMAIGAVPICAALSLAAFRRGRNLDGVCVRKTPKDHGTKSLVEGTKNIAPGSSILLVEDVVTTGSSTIKAAESLRESGYLVDTAITIVDRLAGGEKKLAEYGIKLHRIFDLNDFIEE
jgi:orotate phosphoribosyltransferase